MAKKIYDFAHIHDDAHYADEDVSADVKRLTDLLEIIFDDASTKRANIEINSKLTPEGKAGAREELKVELKTARQGWLNRLTPLDNQIVQIEKGMTLSPHRPDDVVAALREMEMRVEIRKMDPVDIESAYKNAARYGDDLFINAVDNSPVPFKLG